MKLTRNCLDPWSNVMIYANGDIALCCAASSIDNIYKYNLEDLDLNKILNSDKVFEYRNSLLTGKLKESCKNCTHRNMVSIKKLKEEIDRRYMNNKQEDEGDNSTEHAFIEITPKCNFRCIYCSHSNKQFRIGQDMEYTVLDKVVDQLVKRNIKGLTMNGYGETTTYRGWHKVCNNIMSKIPEIKLNLISNFGKEFNEDEIDTLSRFNRISISCDTCNPNLYKKLRKGGKLESLISNIEKIKSRSLEKKRKRPYLAFSCVVSNLNINELIDFVNFGIEIGIDAFEFCNLVIVHGSTGEKELCKISDLTDAEKLRARDTLLKVKEKLNKNKKGCYFSGDLYYLLDKKCREFTFHDFMPNNEDIVYKEIFMNNPKGSQEVHLERFYEGLDVYYGIFIKTGYELHVNLPKGLYKMKYRELYSENENGEKNIFKSKINEIDISNNITFSSTKGEYTIFEVLECRHITDNNIDNNYSEIINYVIQLSDVIEEALIYIKQNVNNTESYEEIKTILEDLNIAINTIDNSMNPIYEDIKNKTNKDLIINFSEKLNLFIKYFNLKDFKNSCEVLNNEVIVSYLNWKNNMEDVL
ncbi:radical SAM protein [Tepidibacter sp. Z1-5]|uniref:radical SAM protein n=1 Tax=Tepidibacter sp. Z1-5 TaxID=3134138 RepID=UPI0030BF05D3